MKCPVCTQDVMPGEDVQPIPPPQKALLGQKSGQLGLYDHPNYVGDEVDYVHYPACCMAYFDPRDNPRVYDDVLEDIRLEIEHDIKEEVREEYDSKLEVVLDKIQQGKRDFCVECYEELEADEDQSRFLERVEGNG